jgi:hypothetical protein
LVPGSGPGLITGEKSNDWATLVVSSSEFEPAKKIIYGHLWPILCFLQEPLYVRPCSTFTDARHPPNPNVGMLRTNKKKGVFVSWKKKKGEQLRVVGDFFRNAPTAYPPPTVIAFCLFIYLFI